MTIRVIAEPRRPVLDPAGILDVYATPLVESLRTAYVVRAAEYERAYAEALNRADVRESGYPTMQLTDADGSTEQIVIDTDILTTLIGRYCTDGWPAVATVVGYAREKSRVDNLPESTSGGTVAEPWLHAYRFLVFARNLLAVMVRDALVEIEYRAARHVRDGLSRSQDVLDEAIDRQYQVTVDDSIAKPFPDVTVGNQALLATVTAGLKQVVAVRTELDRATRALAALESQLAVVRSHEAQRKTSNVGATPDRSTSAGIAAEMTAQTELARTVGAMYDAARAWLGDNAPLAMLILDGLPSSFSEEAVGLKLGLTLWRLRENLRGVAGKVKTDVSAAATLLPRLPAPEPVSSPPDPSANDRAVQMPVNRDDVQALQVPPDGPELLLIGHVMRNLSNDAGLLPFVHEATWHLMLLSGEIPVDSFTYVVARRYLLALDLELQRADRAAEGVRSFFSSFTRLTSALSVALLVTPLAELAPVLRTVSGLSTALLLAYQTYSVVGQIREFDQMLANQLANPDAVSVRGLAAIGGLLVARSEFLTEVGVAIFQELFLLTTGAAWQSVRWALYARGLLLDLESLLGAGDETGGAK